MCIQRFFSPPACPLVSGLLLLLLLFPMAGRGETIRLLTVNLWVGGEGSGLGTTASLQAQKEAISLSQADLVALQEQKTRDHVSRARLLARELGWHLHEISSSRALLSRFPVEPIPLAKPQPAHHNRSAGYTPQAAFVTLPSQKRVLVGVVHLAPAPYEPYEIVDGNLTTAEQAERTARNHRLAEIESLLGEMKPHLDRGLPGFILGDFNEPPCLDWTTDTVKLRRDPAIPFAVDWPCTRLLVNSGFQDAYRTIHPDPVARPGYTWTPRPDPHRRPEVMDRIDMIWSTRGNTKPREALVLGEQGPLSDVAVEPWSSDHRAVVAEFDL